MDTQILLFAVTTSCITGLLLFIIYQLFRNGSTVQIVAKKVWRLSWRIISTLEYFFVVVPLWLFTYVRWFFRHIKVTMPATMGLISYGLFHTRYNSNSPLSWCDPWRDHSATGPRFSDNLLWMCSRSGHARDTAIRNLGLIKYLTNVSHELSRPILDPYGLNLLSTEAKAASHWLTAEIGRTLPTHNPNYEIPASIKNLRFMLDGLASFETEFLTTRISDIEELKTDLIDYRKSLKQRKADGLPEDSPWRNLDIANFFSANQTTPWSTDVEFQTRSAHAYNYTLHEIDTTSNNLIEMLDKAKYRCQRIGEHLVYLRFLQSSRHSRDARRHAYFEGVTGAGASEMMVFEKVFAKLKQPSLELAVFMAVPQIKKAKQALKQILMVKEKGGTPGGLKEGLKLPTVWGVADLEKWADGHLVEFKKAKNALQKRADALNSALEKVKS